MNIRLMTSFRVLKFFMEHSGRDPSAMVVSKETYDVLTQYEADKAAWHTIPFVIEDIPYGIVVLAE